MYKIEQEKVTFEFEGINGKHYSVPTIQDIPLPQFREMQKRINEAGDDREDEAIYATIDLIEAYAKGSTKDLTLRQATQLVKAYIAGEEQTLGES